MPEDSESDLLLNAITVTATATAVHPDGVEVPAPLVKD